MSITTVIQRINGGKQAIRTLASKKNVNIPFTALIDSYASVLGAQWPDCTFNVNYDGDKIQGKTMKWNQLLNHTDSNKTNNGITITTRASGEYTIAVNNAVGYNQIDLGLTGVVGHKFLIVQTLPKLSQNSGFELYFSGTTVPYDVSEYIDECANSRMFLFVGQNTPNGTYKLSPKSIDLTDIFGAGNEPTSISDQRIPFLIQYAKDHPDYDAGSLVYSFYKGTKLGEYDYVDTANNKLVLGGAEVDISQMSLTRFLFGSNYLFYGTNNDQETNTTNVISADYQTAANITDIPDMSVTGNGGTGKNLWFRDDSCTTVEEFKTKNAGKKVYFKLATPTEIDL